MVSLVLSLRPLRIAIVSQTLGRSTMMDGSVAQRESFRGTCVIVDVVAPMHEARRASAGLSMFEARGRLGAARPNDGVRS